MPYSTELSIPKTFHGWIDTEKVCVNETVGLLCDRY